MSETNNTQTEHNTVPTDPRYNKLSIQFEINVCIAATASTVDVFTLTIGITQSNKLYSKIWSSAPPGNICIVHDDTSAAVRQRTKAATEPLIGIFSNIIYMPRRIAIGRTCRVDSGDILVMNKFEKTIEAVCCKVCKNFDAPV